MAGRPIDEKIVVMNIENSEFKRKATETVGIFGKLKQALSKGGDSNLNKATKDLGDIQRAASKVDLSSMSKSLDTISQRFSNLGVVATTALTNITNKAVDAGSRMLDSLTTAQVRSGFNEYELKMKSIGTMLSNTEWEGKGLADVQKNLEELNQYADKTIYSFSEMTASIGRFTAAGVGLDDSTIAIKGLGNLAASSGASVEQLNTAMYQVSQGMAAGKFGLEDWNSMVNAGMGGKKTQDALMATAKAMGKNIDMSDGFRLSLQQGWLTSEVFLETLKQFGEDESMTEMATSVRTFSGMMDALKESIGSGWAQTWELVFGDYEEATRFWTAISKLVNGFFQKSTDSRNNLIKGFINSGVLQAIGVTVRNIAQPIMATFKAIGEAWSIAFPPTPPLGIGKIFTSIANLTSVFKINADTIENIKTIFVGFFSIFSIGITAIKALVSSLTGLIPSFEGTGGSLTDMLAKFAELPIKINEFLQTSPLVEKAVNVMTTIFSGLGQAVSAVASVFIAAGMLIAQAVSMMATGDFTEGIVPKDSKAVDILLKIRDAFVSLFSVVTSVDLSGIGSGISSFFEGIGNTFEWVKQKFSDVVDFFANLGSTIANNQGWILAGGGLAAAAAIIWKVYETFSSLINIGGGLADTLEGVSDSLGAFTLGIHAKSLLLIAMAVGVLAVSLTVLAQLDGKQLATSLGAVVASLTALVAALAVINKYDLSGSTGSILAMMGMAVAVGLLSASLVVLGDMDIPTATTGVLAVTALIASLAGAMVLMSKFAGTLTVGAAQLIAIGGAISLMVVAIKMITGLNAGELTKGLTVLAILLGELAIFVRLASTHGTTMAASAAGILATSGAIIIMVQAIKMISNIPVDQVIKGLGTIGAFLAMIGTFAVVTNDKQILAMGGALVLLAGAMNMLMIPILALGNTQWQTLALGIGALVVSLGALALIASSMTASIPGAIAMTVIAGALNLLVIPIMALGQLQWETILKGIGGLALGLLAFGAVGAILGVLSPAILALAVAIGIFGVGALAAGAGMKLLGTGLLLLSTLTVGAVTVIVTAIGAFITGFTALLPAIVDLVSKVAVAIGETFVKIAPQLGETLGKLMVIIMEKIEEYAPKIIEIFLNMLEALIEKIAEFIPDVVDIVEELVLAILESLGDLVLDGVDIITDFLLALVDKIGEFIPEFVTAGADLIIGFFDGLSEDIPRVIDSMTNFILTMITEMSDTVRNDGQAITSAMLELMGEVILVVIQAGADMIGALFGWIPGVTEATSQIGATAEQYIRENFGAGELGTEKGTEFSTSLSGTSGDASVAGTAIAQAALDGSKEVDGTAGGTWFGEGFINGLANGGIIGRIGAAATNLASTAYNAIKERLDINSPSREAAALGGFTGEGFANGLAGQAKSVVGALFGWEKPAEKAATKVSTAVAKTSTTGATKAANSGATASKKAIQKNTAGVKKEAVKSAEEVAKEAADKAKKAFDEKMDTADYKLEMGEIDQTQYIASLKAIRAEYSKYPELVRESSLEIKKAEEDLAKHKADLLKEQFEKEKEALEMKIDREEITMRKQIDAWMEIRDAYEENSEFYKEADEQVYEARKALTDELSSINKDYLSDVQDTQQQLIDSELEVNDEFAKIYADRRQELVDFVGIFDEVAKEVNEDGTQLVTGAQLVTNLEGQVKAFEDWQKQIASLSAKAIDEGLMSELQEMGPKALKEIRALNALSETELTKYSELYKTKSRLATEQADKELAPLKADTAKRIEEMRAETATQLDKLRDEWKGKIKDITSATSSELQGLHRIGNDAVDGLVNGMREKQGELATVAAEIAAIVDETVRKTLKIKSPSRVMKTLGGYVMEGLIVGIDDLAPDLQSKVKQMAEMVSSGFETMSYVPETNISSLTFESANIDKDKLSHIKSFNEIVINETLSSEKRRLDIEKQYADQRLALTEEKGKRIQNAREEYQKYVDTDREYSRTEEEKVGYVEGMMNTYTIPNIEGLYAEQFLDVHLAEQRALESLNQYRAVAFNNQKKFVEQTKTLYNINKTEQRDLYDLFSQSYKEDSEEYKYFNDLKLSINKELFEADKAYIAKRKQYNKLSLMEELAEYEKFVNAYVAGSEERLYYEEKIGETRAAIHQELLSLSDEYIEKIKQANDELEKAEIDSQNRITEERNKSVKDSQDRLLAAKEEYNNKVSSLNEQSLADQKSIQDQYDQTLKDQIKSLYNFTGLFDKVEKKTGISGKRLLHNLKKQVTTFTNWRNNMNSLSGKGIDEGLMNELREMGPSAAGEIASLNRMSDSQLQEYNNLWKEKSQLAATEAEASLVGLKGSTAQQIEEIKANTKSQLVGYNEEFATQTQLIAKEVNDNFNKIKADIEQDLDEVRKKTQEQLSAYTEEWQSEISKIADVTTNEFDALTATMPEIGQNIIEGIGEGLANASGALMEQVRGITGSISDTIRNTLDMGDILGNMATSSELIQFSDSWTSPFLKNQEPIEANVVYSYTPMSEKDKMMTNIVAPDLSYGNNSANVASNANNNKQMIESSGYESKSYGTGSNQPIVIQNEIKLDSNMNGRVVAQETFNYTNSILGNSVNNRMRTMGAKN